MLYKYVRPGSVTKNWVPNVACVMGCNVHSKEIRCYLARTIQTQLMSGFTAPSQIRRHVCACFASHMPEEGLQYITLGLSMYQQRSKSAQCSSLDGKVG